MSSSIWYAIHYVLRMEENDLLQNPLIHAHRTHEGQAVIRRDKTTTTTVPVKMPE